MGVEVVVEEPVAAFRTGVVVVDFFVGVFVELDVAPPLDVLPDVELELLVPIGTRLRGRSVSTFDVEVVSAVSVLIGPDSRFCFVESARSMSPLVRVPTFSTVVGGVGVVVAGFLIGASSVLGADSIKL